MTPPHVAAGINLSFWPFGVDRAARRRLLHPPHAARATASTPPSLRAYVKQLLRERFPQEFYPEGGRSRSGKLLFPKTGLFSMEVDAWLDERGATTSSSCPSRSTTSGSWRAAATRASWPGGEKTKEDLRGLLQAPQGPAAPLRAPHRAVRGADLAARLRARSGSGSGAQSLTLDDEPRAGARHARAAQPRATSGRSLVQALANRVAYGINRAATVTPGRARRRRPARARPARTPAAEEWRAASSCSATSRRERGARFSRGLAGAPPIPRVPGPSPTPWRASLKEGLIRVERAAGETIYQAGGGAAYAARLPQERGASTATCALALVARAGPARMRPGRAPSPR